MEHSKECLDASARWLVEVDQFKKKYPWYCTRCNGLGMSSSMYTCSFCEGSVDTVPTCRLCGQIMPEVYRIEPTMDGDAIWQLQHVQLCNCLDDSMPSEPECFCWLEWENDQGDSFRHSIETMRNYPY